MADRQTRSNDPSDESIAAELERLRAENAALQAQLQEGEPQVARSARVRSVTSWILVVLAVITVLAAVHAAWLQTTIANEDRFVATFAPLPSDPAVATVLSERVANELIVGSGVAALIESNLPPDLAFLAIPVTEGLRDLTSDVASEVIGSDVFAGIWREMLRLSHEAASLVLSTEGRVSLDLDVAAAEVVSGLEARGVTLLSDVEVDLPEIVIFESEQLEAASGAVRLVDTMGWFLPLLALVFIAAAIWVSPNRHRTTAAIGFGSATAILLMMVVVRLTRAGTVSAIEDEAVRAAGEAVWDTTLVFYRQSLWALLILALVVGLAAWVTGTSPRAERARAWWSGVLRRWRGADATIPTSGFAGFVNEWQRAIQWVVVILALLFLLTAPNPSAWLVILTALVALVVLAVVQVVGGPPRPERAGGSLPDEDTVSRPG